MAQSSDYSYLSLCDGNHILKLPVSFQIPGAGLSNVSKFQPRFHPKGFEGL